jgi:hypothetical protein
MAIFTRLANWCCGDKDSKKDDPKENVLIKDGIRYIRDVKKLSDEELEICVAQEFINCYVSMLELHDQDSDKKAPFDSIGSFTIRNELTKEFLIRKQIRDKNNHDICLVDLSSLHPHLKVFGRPYILQFEYFFSIRITFIFNTHPMKNSISQYTEEEIKSGSIAQFVYPRKDMVAPQNESNDYKEDTTTVINHHHETKESDLLLELTSLRQRKS